MDVVRLATPEEIASIEKTSDITPQTTVVVYENSATGKPDIAVLRQVFEVDPILFGASTNNRRKVAFLWSLENSFRIMGSPQAYYFNVLASDGDWLDVVKSWGAEQVSVAPEYRFKRLLTAPFTPVPAPVPPAAPPVTAEKALENVKAPKA